MNKLWIEIKKNWMDLLLHLLFMLVLGITFRKIGLAESYWELVPYLIFLMYFREVTQFQVASKFTRLAAREASDYGPQPTMRFFEGWVFVFTDLHILLEWLLPSIAFSGLSLLGDYFNA